MLKMKLPIVFITNKSIKGDQSFVQISRAEPLPLDTYIVDLQRHTIKGIIPNAKISVIRQFYKSVPYQRQQSFCCEVFYSNGIWRIETRCKNFPLTIQENYAFLESVEKITQIIKHKFK